VSSKIRLGVVRHCPVVGHSILLSCDQWVMDYIVLREDEPTCSNIHECLSKWGDIKHISGCLLHDAEAHFGTDGAEGPPESGGPSITPGPMKASLSVLERSRRHVAAGETRVARQKALIVQLEGKGHHAYSAVRLLDTFEQTLAAMRQCVAFEVRRAAMNARFAAAGGWHPIACPSS